MFDDNDDFNDDDDEEKGEVDDLVSKSSSKCR
jgi:hypothetical protein